MQSIYPNLWFARHSVEAGEWYASVLPRTTSRVAMRYPAAEVIPEFQRAFAGQPLLVDVNIDGFVIRLINGGDGFAPNPAMSFMLNFDPASDGAAADRIDEVWAALTDGGTVRMPLDEYPFSRRYGWVADRWGVDWQLILTDPAGDPRPFVIPALTFTGDEARAETAIATYTALFPDSRTGTVAKYPADAGALPGGVQFAEFQIAGQWFTAMDGGPQHDFALGVGTSLEVDCATQEEIDHYWNGLSAVPDAEVCGWLQDRFGLSWQIAPTAIEQLLASPDAYRAMLGMKRIVIAELEAAAASQSR